MNLETEQLKLKLIETQMMLLQYQHKEVTANIAALQEPSNVAHMPVKTYGANS